MSNAFDFSGGITYTGTTGTTGDTGPTGTTGFTDTIYDPTIGSLVVDNTGFKIPIITYNQTTDIIIFNNPIIPSGGIAVETGNLTFTSPAIFNQSITVGYTDPSLFLSVPIPSAPFNLSIPAVSSGGTIQTTDIWLLMLA